MTAGPGAPNGWAPAAGPGSGGGFVPSAGPPPPTWNPGADTGLSAAPTLGRADQLATRRFLRIQPSGRSALLLAGMCVVLWLVVNDHAILTLALALVLAIVVDAVIALRSIGSAQVVMASAGAPVADEPTRWSIRVDALTRPLAVHPVRYPLPPDVLIERGGPAIVTLPPTPRGVIHFVVLDLTATGPVGLTKAGRRVRATPPQPVIVGPRSIPLNIRWPLPRAVAYGLNEVAPRGDDLFRGVRPDQRGDERRKIHWKATARTNELMVREDDGTGVVALQVVVDLGPPGRINEHIVANATWLAEAAVARGWVVQLVTVDDTPGVPRVSDLGSPFGRFPITVAAPARPPQVLAQTVTNPAAIRRQLATAAPGSPTPPGWIGLRCRVTAHGVEGP